MDRTFIEQFLWLTKQFNEDLSLSKLGKLYSEFDSALCPPELPTVVSIASHTSMDDLQVVPNEQVILFPFMFNCGY
jgi:hypothetical protein